MLSTILSSNSNIFRGVTSKSRRTCTSQVTSLCRNLAPPKLFVCFLTGHGVEATGLVGVRAEWPSRADSFIFFFSNPVELHVLSATLKPSAEADGNIYFVPSTHSVSLLAHSHYSLLKTKTSARAITSTHLRLCESAHQQFLQKKTNSSRASVKCILLCEIL